MQRKGQTDLEMRYVYHLYGLHTTAGNRIEAGLALAIHADRLAWSDAQLSAEQKRHQGQRKVATQRELKENVLREIISLFDKGEHWEGAIRICKDLQVCPAPHLGTLVAQSSISFPRRLRSSTSLRRSTTTSCRCC